LAAARFRHLSRWAEKALAEMLVELLVRMQAETVSAKVLVMKGWRQILGERAAIAFWP
jgi:hypothetical protein